MSICYNDRRMSVHSGILAPEDRKPRYERETALRNPAPGAPPAAETAQVTENKTLIVDGILGWVDRHRLHILLGVVSFYLAGFTGVWRLEPDSARYLSIARNLAQGKGYTYLGEPDLLAYPGLPWAWAASFKAFGVDNLLPPHLIMLAVAGLTLYMLFALVRLRFGRPTAVLVTAIVALSDTFFRYAFQLRNDLPFLAGVAAVLLGYELMAVAVGEQRTKAQCARCKLLGVGLVVAGLLIAAFMRPAFWAIASALGVAVTWSLVRGRLSWRYILSLGLAGAVVVLFLMFDPRQEASSLGIYEQTVLGSLQSGEMFRRMFDKNISQMLGRITVEAMLGTEVGVGLNQVVAILALICAVRLVVWQPLWALTVLMNMAMFAAVFPLKRYYMPIVPLLVLGNWQGIVWLNQRLRNQKLANWLCAALLALLVVPNVVRSANYVLQQRGVFTFSKDDRGLEFAMLRELAADIRQRIGVDDVVIVQPKFGGILAYLSDRRVVAANNATSAQTIANRKVYVAFPGDAPDPALSQTMEGFQLVLGKQVAVISPAPGHQFRLFEAEKR